MSCSTTESGMGLRRIALSTGAGVLVVSVSGVTGKIALSVPSGGYWKYHIWLSDSATDADETDNAPGGGQYEWEGVTDSDGNATEYFTNNATTRTWYAWVTVIKANVSAPLALGV